MSGSLAVKTGVQFTVISPAGFRILSALDTVARSLGVQLVITSACDGMHSGPNDPHHLGAAFDVRSKTLAPAVKADFLHVLLAELSDHAEPIVSVSTGLATSLFYAQLEDPGGENEHVHCQLRTGRSYPSFLKTGAVNV